MNTETANVARQHQGLHRPCSPVLWSFQDVTVEGRLWDVTLEIPCGVTAVLGPSGSGKSTLLDVLAGVLKVTESGSDGVTESSPLPNSPTPRLPHFSAGHGDGLWPHRTAGQQISDVGGDPSDWLPRFDLAGRKNARPGQLSQGERSRLELARALAADPATLLLDEPLTHVDRRRAAAGWDELHRWTKREDRSLIFSTHDLAAAARLATHVVCLDGGRVVDAGPWDRVVREPACEQAAWCVGVGS